MRNNLLTLSDSYKYSHFAQYPEGTETIFSYLESRGGVYANTVFFGLHYYLKEYLSKPFIESDIDVAKQLAAFQGIPFHLEGWKRILGDHGGYLPLLINAVPELGIYPSHTPLMTIQNTDKKIPWITNWTETLLSKVWYPTTVATKSFYVKEIIKGAFAKGSDSDFVDYQYHNFGDRGSSSVESAAIGGMAHLTQFQGTDNFNSVLALQDYYGTRRGKSIVATEHSTVTSWGKENEFAMVEKLVEDNRGANMIACVGDSYDIYNFTDYVTKGEIKTKIESFKYPVFVIRPDSGSPSLVMGEMLKIMERNNVAYTRNSKGFKVFNKYRILWGDGINPKEIMQILNFVISMGYSPEIIAFGSGGDLMQNINRDTCKFAIKCSAAEVNGVWRDVFKDPITDQGKRSKKGILISDDLRPVFKNGEILCNVTF